MLMLRHNGVIRLYLAYTGQTPLALIPPQPTPQLAFYGIVIADREGRGYRGPQSSTVRSYYGSKRTCRGLDRCCRGPG